MQQREGLFPFQSTPQRQLKHLVMASLWSTDLIRDSTSALIYLQIFWVMFQMPISLILMLQNTVQMQLLETMAWVKTSA